jgi:outer membrane protein OmpA-like peptidoglycan-associated protein
LVFLFVSLTGCSRANEWVEHIVDRNSRNLLLAYDTVRLRDNVEPELSIEFSYGSSKLKTEYVDQLDSLVDKRRLYIVEGTAGGVEYVELAMQRALIVASVLEDVGVATKNISIAEYNPKRTGGQAHVYSIEK